MVFCLSLIALYSASSVYHFSGRGERPAAAEKARPQHDLCADRGQLHADYSQIHACAAQLYLSWRDLADCADRHCIKLLWIDAPRLIGTALYLALGWAIAFDFGVVLSMPAPAIALLAAGGLAYTVGGVIYIAKKPNLGLMIGFHELFHLFVIVAAFVII